MTRIFALGFCLVWLACAESRLVGPTVAPNQEVTLSPGETAAIVDSAVRVQFVAVSADSRCPSDALCIRAGDATVHIRLFNGGARADHALLSGEPTRAWIVQAGFRIELVRVDPYPVSTRPIAQGDYRATLKITAA